ncbi:MAG TPA: PINc/VapC family ATPase [archaeon]|nr:PINc/VapC family ATPase [archaeon]
MVKRIIPDTSVIIDGILSRMMEKNQLKDAEIVIPLAVVDELQAQASKGREHGFVGLEELKKLRKMSEEKGVKLRFTGDRPSFDDIRLAKSGRMDALIRDVAKNENGVLMTSDYVQALVGEAEGAKIEYIAPEIKTAGLRFEKFFDDTTLSVHLKSKVPPLAKKGKPGKFELTKLADKPLSDEDLEIIIKEIAEATRISGKGSIEISRSGALVIQLGLYRIAIARPPFSSGLEVTIVRPLVKLSLADYKFSDKLLQRLRERSEGILIAGPPGSGKSTLAASLAEFYAIQGKIVKTLESPRDLQVGPEITQYGPLEGDFEKTADILLLVRPDYSVYDEVRKTRDFEIFADMRLAGVGMIGVVHASNPIDAVQRFMGRIELGMVPHIIDTIIFVKEGQVKKVYELSLTVRVPTGMTEADLARPVVDVRDFETGQLDYEIYSFGEESVVIPVAGIPKQQASPLKELAKKQILLEIRKFDPAAEVEVVDENNVIVKVDNNIIARIIGKEGSMITSIQDRLGIHIDVEPRTPALGKEAQFDINESGNSFDFEFDKRLIGKMASFYIEDKFLFSATIGKKSSIKIGKESDIGHELMRAIVGKKKMKVLI